MQQWQKLNTGGRPFLLWTYGDTHVCPYGRACTYYTCRCARRCLYAHMQEHSPGVWVSCNLRQVIWALLLFLRGGDKEKGSWVENLLPLCVRLCPHQHYYPVITIQELLPEHQCYSEFPISDSSCHWECVFWGLCVFHVNPRSHQLTGEFTLWKQEFNITN